MATLAGMPDPLEELTQRVSRPAGEELSVGFSGDDAEILAVEAVAGRIVWVQSIDVTVAADGDFSILDGAGGDAVVGPVPGTAGGQYTYGPFRLTAGNALAIVPPTGIVAGGNVTYRIV